MAKKSPQPNDNTPLNKRLRELAEKANLTRDQLMRMSLVPTDKEPTIPEMVAEGAKLIEEEESKRSLQEQLKKYSDASAPEKKDIPPEKTQADNPYFQARMKILEKYPEWRRNEIKNMEKEGKLDNRFYAEFVSQVRELGDKLSQ